MKFRQAFPHLVAIGKFYVKLRRILRDGERLQKSREQLGEGVFQRRLNKLKDRLEALVNWPNPDEVLEAIIKKIKRQQPHILTFVEHLGVPNHNNYAEYLIRIGVLKRKISGGVYLWRVPMPTLYCCPFIRPVVYAVFPFPGI